MNDLIRFLTVIAIVLVSFAAAITITYYNSYGNLPGMVP